MRGYGIMSYSASKFCNFDVNLKNFASPPQVNNHTEVIGHLFFKTNKTIQEPLQKSTLLSVGLYCSLN